MKFQQLKNPITIQFIIIGILLTAIGFKYFLTDNLRDYKSISNYEQFFQEENNLILHSTEQLFWELEYVTNDAPNFNPYLESCRNIQETISRLQIKIEDIREIMIENAGGRYFGKKQKYSGSRNSYEDVEEMKTKRDTLLWGMPRYYYSVKPVRQTFLKENQLAYLVKTWEEVKEELEKVVIRKIPSSTIEQSFLDSMTKRNQVVINQLNLLAILENPNRFKKKIRKMDVLHTSFFLRTLQHELILMEYQLINNYGKIISQKKDHIIHNYKIMMSPEKPPKVGEIFKADIYPISYVLGDENMEFYVNGQKLEVKEGIGKYTYTPKTRGTKYFNVMIKTKNPFTNKTNVYKRRQKIEVY